MARLLERLPISFGFGLWDMANGNKYTNEDNSIDLPQELAESDAQTDKAYDERFRQQPKKGNGGKGKESKLKEDVKVGKEQLNKDQVQTPKKEKISKQKEIGND